MAAYREHLTVSTGLGIGVGLVAANLAGFTPVQGAVAGMLTSLGGILPDLDSESGRPVRVIFGLVGALVPMMLIRQLEAWGGTFDGALLLGVLLYVAIRFGGAELLGLVAVHRGMFHSIPALLIAGELVYLGYRSDHVAVRALMGCSVALGFLSHLVLDEIYAVQWNGIVLRLNKAAGSAVKLFGKSWGANVVTYGLLFATSYVMADGLGLVNHETGWPELQRLRQAEKAIEADLQHAQRVERIDLRRE